MKIETVEKLLDLKARKQQVPWSRSCDGAQDLFTEGHHAPALNSRRRHRQVALAIREDAIPSSR